jgi:hypothetical protein
VLNERRQARASDDSRPAFPVHRRVAVQVDASTNDERHTWLVNCDQLSPDLVTQKVLPGGVYRPALLAQPPEEVRIEFGRITDLDGQRDPEATVC